MFYVQLLFLSSLAIYGTINAIQILSGKFLELVISNYSMAHNKFISYVVMHVLLSIELPTII